MKQIGCTTQERSMRRKCLDVFINTEINTRKNHHPLKKRWINILDTLAINFEHILG